MDGMQDYAKPKYSYVYLIALAINNNMEKQMSLKDIYEYIMENYPFYRHPESGRWKASIRLTLSTNVRKKVNCKKSVWALHPDSIGMFEGGMTIRRKKQFRVTSWHDDYIGHIEKDGQRSKKSTSVLTSDDIPDSIPLAQYLTESSQCQHEGDTFKRQASHEPSYQFNCNNMTLKNVSKSIPLSTFDFQFPESQATNNPNMFQFQQNTPSMSTVPQDVVNFDPIWPPQVQLDNMPRAYEVAKGRKAHVQEEIESPQCQFQFNSMPGIHKLDGPAFPISTLPTPKGQSHYICQDLYSVPSGHHLTETPQGQFQCNTTPGPHHAFSFSQQFLSTSHDIPDSILFAQYLTESPQPQCQVMPGIYGLYNSTSQATNNPNTFQFQQKMPSMSTVPRDVVNFDPIWPPQDKDNNVPESRYEEDTSSENYF